MHISLFKDCDTYKHIFPVDENNRKIDVYKFEECNITGLNLYYPNVLLNVKDSLILPLFYSVVGPTSQRIAKSFQIYILPSSGYAYGASHTQVVSFNIQLLNGLGAMNASRVASYVNPIPA